METTHFRSVATFWLIIIAESIPATSAKCYFFFFSFLPTDIAFFSFCLVWILQNLFSSYLCLILKAKFPNNNAGVDCFFFFFYNTSYCFIVFISFSFLFAICTLSFNKLTAILLFSFQFARK